MPLIKSTSKRAFGENVAAERRAGRPQKQAVAIAYAVKREAQKRTAKRMRSGTENHSAHSAERSKHYDSSIKNVKATRVQRGPAKMTQARSLWRNDEDWDEKG